MIPRGLIIIGLAVASWTIVLLPVWAFRTPTLAEMQANPRLYTPTNCTASPCVLTGLGGYLSVWDDWADAVMKRGWSFVVVGVCASACEREFERARMYQVEVSLTPGSVLIYHKPELLNPDACTEVGRCP